MPERNEKQVCNVQFTTYHHPLHHDLVALTGHRGSTLFHVARIGLVLHNHSLSYVEMPAIEVGWKLVHRPGGHNRIFVNHQHS